MSKVIQGQTFTLSFDDVATAIANWLNHKNQLNLTANTKGSYEMTIDTDNETIEFRIIRLNQKDQT